MSMIVSEIQEFIAQANGFENHYKHRLFRGYSYSDGIKFIAEKAGAYWLIDAIFSHSKEKRLQERCD